MKSHNTTIFKWIAGHKRPSASTRPWPGPTSGGGAAVVDYVRRTGFHIEADVGFGIADKARHWVIKDPLLQVGLAAALLYVGLDVVDGGEPPRDRVLVKRVAGCDFLCREREIKCIR